MRQVTINWTAPEHARWARRMRRNHRGDLIIDPRPTVMRLARYEAQRRRPITVKGYERARAALQAKVKKN